MTARVFISYRAGDGADKATALARDLDRLFGDEQVFLDKDDLAAGSRWRDEIARAIGAKPILLVLVTPQYLGAVDAHGRRRIERDDDPARLELSAALGAGAHVVPVMCDGVDRIPDAAALPAPFDQLAELTWRRLRTYDWREDVARLAADLERLGVARRREAAARRGGTAAADGGWSGSGDGDGSTGRATDTGGRRKEVTSGTGNGTVAGTGTGSGDPRARRRLVLAAIAVAAAVAGAFAWLAWRQPGVASRSPSHPLAPVSLPAPALSVPAAVLPVARDAANASPAGGGAAPRPSPVAPVAPVVPDAPALGLPAQRDAAPPSPEAGDANRRASALSGPQPSPQSWPPVAQREAAGPTLAEREAALPPTRRDTATLPQRDAAPPSPAADAARRPAAATATAPDMSGRWVARIGMRGAPSATGGTPVFFEVTHEGDRLKLVSDPVDIDRDPEWQDYREFWQQRHRRPLERVRWRGEGELIRNPGEPRRVSLAMRVESAAGGEPIDDGNLSGWVGDAGGRIEGRLWVNSEQGERPMVLRKRSALLPSTR